MCKFFVKEFCPAFKVKKCFRCFFFYHLENFQCPIFFCIIGRVKDKYLPDFFPIEQFQFGLNPFQREICDGFFSL